MAEPQIQAQSDDEILVEARKRLALAADAESPNRTEALTDLEFGNGDQWPVDIKRDRDTDGRPCLTINITDAMVRRVCNALRENRPRIKPHPVGSNTNPEDAQAADGVIRHIEVSSGADYAYDCGVESAVRGGWGYWRVGSKYIDDRSDEQDLTIEAITNPFTVYKDPASRAPDGSDMNWCLVSEWISREEYAQRYGDEGMRYSRFKTALSAIGSAFNFIGAGDEINDWSRKEELRLAEYWRVTQKMDTLWLYASGDTIARIFTSEKAAYERAGFTQVKKLRDVLRRTVEWYLLSGDRVLDRRDWPGKWIPIIACYGRQTDLNGRIVRKGMIRDLRDLGRMFNYSETSKTEVYALQPKAPWLGAEGFMEGHEAAWRDANRKPIVGLEYKPIQLEDGTFAPPPERQTPPVPAAGFTEWSQSNQSNFLFVAGMPHEPDADKKGEVVSGIAIKKREGLADVSHFDFYDNQVRSLRHTGHVLVDLFPYFYDTRRIQTIIKPDGKPDQITLNDPAESLIKNNLKTATFGIVIDTGPSYATQREESAEAKLELMATPLGEMVGKAAGDLVIRGMNFENADEIADRLQAQIPGAQIDKDSDLPPKAQIIIAGLQAQLKQDRQQLLAAHLELEAKHGLQKIKEDGENHRLQFKEAAETERTRMELGVKREDTQTNAHVKVHDTHVRAVTAHDVAEIQAAATLMNTNTEAAHNKAAAKEALKAGEQAEKREE
jgi:Phage P22-like portal protein